MAIKKGITVERYYVNDGADVQKGARSMMKYSRSREKGENSVTLIVRISEKRNEKEVKKAIHQAIRILKNAMDGKTEFEYVISPSRHDNRQEV